MSVREWSRSSLIDAKQYQQSSPPSKGFYVATLQTIEEGDVLVVFFTDAKILDEARIQEIGRELIDMVGTTPSGKLLLNFKAVSFMSSAMIGKIIQLNKKCREAKVDLRLCEISDNVMEVFKLMRLNKVLNIQKDQGKAVASFDKKGWFG